MSNNTHLGLSEGIDVEQVIGELWQLKKLYGRHSGESAKPLNFDHLLRKKIYRDKVLEQLSKVKNKEISQLATSLKAQKLPGSVHIDDIRASQSAATTDVNVERAYTEEIDSLRENLSQYITDKQSLASQLLHFKYITIAVSLCLALSMSLQLIPFLINLTMDDTVELVDSITEDMNFRAEITYILKKPIFVEGKATLNIEAGTTILGEPGAALIITRDAKLIAKGTSEQPIVFTSSKAAGLRKRGDWGGLVLLGNAPVNRPGQLEGIDKDDPRGVFGGKDVSSNCGSLEYIRVEFAGYETFVDNELNGLTLGACGTETIVRNVQIHKALDDGIEVFGGTVDLKNIVVTGAGDDAFDWDMGWTGRVQFLVVQMHDDDGDNAFEGDNYSKDENALPRSAPHFNNVTLLGANNSQVSHRAMTIRRGSGGIFTNILIAGFSKESIDLRGDYIQQLVENNDLNFNDILMFDIANGKFFEEEVGDEDDDLGFDERGYFSQPDLHIKFGLDPRLTVAAYNAASPEFSPQGHSPARESNTLIPQGEFWDEGASYIGAIRPGTAVDWTDGWTAFPSF